MNLLAKVSNVLSIEHRGYLQGILFGDWLRLILKNPGSLGLRYWKRTASVTLGSVLNSILHLHESVRFDESVREVKCHPPVFILGLWRSGTTHLHNLFSQDDRFAYPNYIQTMNPHTFLTAEGFMSRLMAPSIPQTRGIDNVKMGSNLPEEDEFALLALSLHSCYLDAPFPHNTQFYSRYRTFRRASRAEVRRWKLALKFFVQKLTFKYDKPMVLKSPAHTGRVRMILDVFPDAKFVYIHRNPFEVFQSFTNLIKITAPILTSQSVQSNPDYTPFVIDSIKELNNAYYEDRDLIPKGNLIELTYERLTEDTLGQLNAIYESLGLPTFGEAEPALRSYLNSIASYKKNALPMVSVEIRSKLEREWSQYIKEWEQAAESNHLCLNEG